MAKRLDKLMEVLRYINDLGDEMFSMDRRAPWRNILGSYPSEFKRATNRLEKSGWIEKKQIGNDLSVKITEQGRRQVILHLLGQVGSKKGKWDGKWRIVFFDIDNKDRRKRDRLRSVLKGMGFKELQESVYVTPYNCEREVKYMKEALGVEDEVRMGIMESIEGEEELKNLFISAGDGDGQEEY